PRQRPCPPTGVPLLRPKIGSGNDRLNGQRELFCKIVGGVTKRVRGVRPLERQVEGRDDPTAEVVRGYCAAVRSALTDAGRPPLDAKGLLLKDRLSAIAASLDRVAEKRGYPLN